MRYRISDIEIITESHSVKKSGVEIKLTQIEWNMLLYLIENKGRVCKRSEILDNVWGQKFQYDTGTIDVHLNAIRRKLGFTKEYPIEVVRGVGLIFHKEALTDTQTQQTQIHQNLEWAKLFTTMLPNNLKSCNLSSLIIDAVNQFDAQVQERGINCMMKLDPYINDIITDEATMNAILTSVLSVLIPNTKERGKILVSSRLNLSDFLISITADGRCPDFNVPQMLAAQRFAALLWMPMQMTNTSTKMVVEMRVPLKR